MQIFVYVYSMLKSLSTYKIKSIFADWKDFDSTGFP